MEELLGTRLEGMVSSPVPPEDPRSSPASMTVRGLLSTLLWALTGCPTKYQALYRRTREPHFIGEKLENCVLKR